MKVSTFERSLTQLRGFFVLVCVVSACENFVTPFCEILAGMFCPPNFCTYRRYSGPSHHARQECRATNLHLPRQMGTNEENKESYSDFIGCLHLQGPNNQNELSFINIWHIVHNVAIQLHLRSSYYSSQQREPAKIGHYSKK